MTSIGTATKPIASCEGQPATTPTPEKTEASPGEFDRILKGLKHSPTREHEHQPATKQAPVAAEVAPEPDQPPSEVQAQIDEPVVTSSEGKAELELAAALLLAATPLATLPPPAPQATSLADASLDVITPVSADAVERESFRAGFAPTDATAPAVVTTANAVPSAPLPFPTAPLTPASLNEVVGNSEPLSTPDTIKAEPLVRRETVGVPTPQVPREASARVAAPDLKPEDAARQIPPEEASAQRPATVSVPEKTSGMSIALQSSMQEAPTQHAKPAVRSAQPAVPPISLGTPSQPSAPAQNENFAGNREREEPAAPEQAPAPVSTVPIFPAAPSVTTSRAPAITFAAGPEKTERVTAVVNHVLESADKMRSDGRTNAEVQVRLHDGNELTIQLRWNDGQLRPVFKTESLELRNAIEQNWSQFSTSATERGMRITNPVFEAPQSSMGDLNQRQNREQAQQQATPWSETFPAAPQPKTRVVSPRAAEKSKEGLALYA